MQTFQEFVLLQEGWLSNGWNYFKNSAFALLAGLGISGATTAQAYQDPVQKSRTFSEPKISFDFKHQDLDNKDYVEFWVTIPKSGRNPKQIYEQAANLLYHAINGTKLERQMAEFTKNRPDMIFVPTKFTDADGNLAPSPRNFIQRKPLYDDQGTVVRIYLQLHGTWKVIDKDAVRPIKGNEIPYFPK